MKAFSYSIFFLLLFGALQAAGDQTIYGIGVKFTNVSFPELWRVSYSPDCRPARVDKVSDATLALRSAMSLYPKKLLEQNLESISLCNYLGFTGNWYSGTNEYKLKALWFADAVLLWESPFDLSGAFHHEFSSILFWRNQSLFPFEAWIKINDGGMRAYTFGLSSDTNSFQGNIDLNPSEEYLLKGFIAPYGTTSFENDLNTYF